MARCSQYNVIQTGSLLNRRRGGISIQKRSDRMEGTQPDTLWEIFFNVNIFLMIKHMLYGTICEMYILYGTI